MRFPVHAIYRYEYRGSTTRRLVPRGGQTPGNSVIVPRNDATIVGSKLVSNRMNRTFFDFQNQSDTAMRLNFGAPATANIGYLIPVGNTIFTWGVASDIGIVCLDVHVFCTVAGKIYSFSEAGA